MDFDNTLELFYSRLVAKGDVVVDVGAHAGRHTIPLSRLVGNSGRVIAFEPLPGMRHHLNLNLAAANVTNADVLAYALAAETGKSFFHNIVAAPAYSGLLKRDVPIESEVEVIEVEKNRLDRIDMPTPSFVKIDAEGGDFDIIRGAEGILRRGSTVFAFEFGMNACHLYNFTPDDLLNFAAGLDHFILDVYGQELNGPEFKTAVAAGKTWDWYIAPARSREKVRAIFDTLPVRSR